MTESVTETRRGLILINTGPGKGKTTAAMGTALRAVGNGMRVLMLQFLKGSWHYGELDSTKVFGENFVLRQMGRGFVKIGGAETDPEDIRLVEAAWEEARVAILSGVWDMVILDEINYAISYGMLDPAKVVETLEARPEMVHVILTGRNAHPSLVAIADTVTEMREVKHAYQKGSWPRGDRVLSSRLQPAGGSQPGTPLHAAGRRLRAPFSSATRRTAHRAARPPALRCPWRERGLHRAGERSGESC